MNSHDMKAKYIKFNISAPIQNSHMNWKLPVNISNTEFSELILDLQTVCPVSRHSNNTTEYLNSLTSANVTQYINQISMTNYVNLVCGSLLIQEMITDKMQIKIFHYKCACTTLKTLKLNSVYKDCCLLG
jgi:hypothetical protein